MAGVSSVRPGVVTPVKAIHPDEALHKTLREDSPASANDSRQRQQGESAFEGASNPRALQLVSSLSSPSDPARAPPVTPPTDASTLAQAAPQLSQLGKLAQLGPVPQIQPGDSVSQIHAGAPSDLKPTQRVGGASETAHLFGHQNNGLGNGMGADIQKQRRMFIAA